jgi:SIR2-like domain
MARLAIIFGAGASYDFLPTYPPSPGDRSLDRFREDRIPLADHLFENRPEFASIASKLPRLIPLLPELRNRSGNRSVEQILEELNSLEKNHRYWRQRQRELAAIRFYLQQAIWSSEAAMVSHAAGVSNYTSLIRYIEEFRQSEEPVILITFNYDTLIEAALSLHFGDFNFGTTDDYVRRSSYKLFKLHGSVNWGHFIEDDARIDVHQPAEHLRKAIIDLADDIRYRNNQFTVLDGPNVKVEDWLYLPAISIPVQQKSHFSCPQEWLPQLDTLLDGVSNLLVIGWRGGEEHFLERVVPVLNKNAEFHLSVVSHTATSANETQIRLRGAGLRLAQEASLFGGGFTNFISSDDVKTFLRRGGNVV